jgi:hypothetical protein
MNRHRAVVASCATLVFAALLAPVAVRAGTPPAWMYATPGTRALLGTDGEDAPVAIVCKTAHDYATMESGTTMPANSCTDRAEGTLIVIDSIVPKGANCDQANALLGIHAVDGSWKGYAAIDAVFPLIPAGAIMTLNGSSPQRTTIASGRGAFGAGAPVIGSSATVKFVSFKPASFDRDLLVTVESGPHAGLRGWTFLEQTLVAGKEADRILCPAPKS